MMKNKEFIQNLISGLFFIGGVVLIFMFILTIGKDKGLNQDKFDVHVLFGNVAGLIEGAPTRLAGVTVGHVKHIEFLDPPQNNKKVRVVLTILKEFENPLKNGTQVAIKTEGILGEKLVEVMIMDHQKKIDFQSDIMGVDPFDVQDVADSFKQAALSFSKTADEMQQIDMLELSEVMIDSSRAMLNTANGLNAIMDELVDITKKSKRLLNRVEQKIIDGDLFKVF